MLFAKINVLEGDDT